MVFTFAVPEWEGSSTTPNFSFKSNSRKAKKTAKDEKKRAKLKLKQQEEHAGTSSKAKPKTNEYLHKTSTQNDSVAGAKRKKNRSLKKNGNKLKSPQLEEINSNKTKAKKKETVVEGQNNKVNKAYGNKSHKTLNLKARKQEEPTSQPFKNKKNKKLKDKNKKTSNMTSVPHFTSNEHQLTNTPTNKKKLKNKINKKALETNTHDSSSTKSTNLKNITSLSNASIKKKKLQDNKKAKLKKALQNTVFTPINPSETKSPVSLRQRMLDKLKGAKFRFLNEQLYVQKGNESLKHFKQNPADYQAYHEGYRHQVSKWPINPVDIIIEDVKKLPQSKTIADFGCGEAKLAKSVSQQVHSFDLVSSDESVVTACDMAHVPLGNDSVDVAVFCLSLMGTNLKDYLLEACRVLNVGGLIKIAEVESRIDNVDAFVSDVEKFGFEKKKVNLSHNLFCFMDFVKKGSCRKKAKLPDLQLSPCLYKKR